MQIIDLFYIFPFFVIALFLGSFFGVVIDRLPFGKSLVVGRSKCDHCGRTLGGLDLFPIFSFLFLRGKCRYCHKNLSIYYPIMELTTAAVLTLTVVSMNHNLQSMSLHAFFTIILYLVVVSCLVIIFFTDLKYGLIPFLLVAIATIATFFLLFLQGFSLQSHFLSGVGAGLFFLIIFFGTKQKGMGFGDVVYSFFMGFLLGFPSVVFGLYIAFLTGSVVALILILRKEKKLKSSIAFGPFLVLGTFVLLLWEDQVFQLARIFLPI